MPTTIKVDPTRLVIQFGKRVGPTDAKKPAVQGIAVEELRTVWEDGALVAESVITIHDVAKESPDWKAVMGDAVQAIRREKNAADAERDAAKAEREAERTERQAERKALTAERDERAQKAADRKKQVADLESEVQVLRGQTITLENKVAELQSKLDATPQTETPSA